MNLDVIRTIANAVLYEGYLLYPYRKSAVKNQQRFNFGVLYPRDYCDRQQGSEAWEMRTECLLSGAPSARIETKVRFLQLVTHQERQEGVEREMDLPPCGINALRGDPLRRRFRFEPGIDENGAVRAELEAEVELAAQPAGEGLCKLILTVRNMATESAGDAGREDILLRSLVSVHSVLHADGGEFVSLMDPGETHRAAAQDCRNVGCWPVLVGDESKKDLLLSSPIILYDYPEIAPESPGDLFDGLEIDEILALRILTLTDEEKQEVRGGDERARAILERTEKLPGEHFQKLHGALRGLRHSTGGAR